MLIYILRSNPFLLLHNDDLNSIYTFQIKSSLMRKVQINNFFCFLNFLNFIKEHSIQHFTIELLIKVCTICEFRF